MTNGEPPITGKPRSAGRCGDFDELDFLSNAALELAEVRPEPEGDIFQFIAEQLATLAPDTLVVTNSYEPSTDATTVRAIVGPPDMTAQLRDLIGTEPIGLTFQVDDDARQGLAEGKLLRLEGGLHQATFHSWPLAFSRDLEMRLGVRSFYGQPFARKGDYLGTAVFISRAPALARVRLIEAFTRLSAVAIHSRRADARLREADRRKNEFLAVLSHELRNPLAPIRNSLYILERIGEAGPQAKRALAIIDRQLTHLTRLVDDLLDLTRITQGKIRLQVEGIELNELVNATVEDHRSIFASRGIELEVLTAPFGVWIEGDRTRIAQIIGNLLQNAAKFTPSGGKATVSVGTDIESKLAVLRVRDTGAGIAPELLPRLFEPFMQGDKTLDRSKGGLGLGLVLVKNLVQMHDGSVGVTSDGAGNGTEFTVRLPMRKAPMSARNGDTSSSAEEAWRVLIIEDNVDAADSLREVLELGDGAVEVEVAYTGIEGLEKARTFRPDIVLCDIGLPGMDGYAVAHAIRADPELNTASLIALSGYASAADVEKSRRAGFDRHVAKPPRLEALESLMAELMSQR